VELRRITLLVDRRAEEGVRDLRQTLDRLGLGVEVLEAIDDLPTLVEQIQKSRPDLVVNLVERFAGNLRLAPDVAAALDVMNMPYTGAGPAGLYLAADPSLLRRLLRVHDIDTAFGADDPPGDDVLLAMIGNERLEIALASVHPASAEGVGLIEEDEMARRDALVGLARAAFPVARLRDYGLIVARVPAAGGRPLFVRAVPNPRLARDGDLARAFLRTGDRYEEMVRRIVSAAWQRREVEQRAEV
jgi:hypothetical protein